HHSMPTETVRQKKSRHFGDRSKNRVMVRGHLIQTCPGALRIHSNVLEYRHTVCRMNQNLFNKRRIKIHLISRCFVRVVPRHQESQAFGPEMKSGRYVDNHGRGVRKLIERLGRDEHAPQWLDW